MPLADLRRTLRERIAPIAIWVGAVAASIALYTNLIPGGPVKGFASATEYRIAPLSGGRLSQLAVSAGERVASGQIVAVLDAAPVDADIRIVTAQRAQLEAEILKAKTEARATVALQTGDRDDAQGSAQRSLRDARAELAAKRAELRAVKRQLTEQRALVAKGHLAENALASLEIQSSRLTKEVAEARQSVALLSEQEEALAQRFAPDAEDYAAKVVAPLAEELRVLDARLEVLRERRSALVLRSPVDGQVSRVWSRTGEVVAAEAAVTTIIADNRGLIVACVPEERLGAVTVGMVASLRRSPIGPGDTALDGRTVSVGPIIELPPRCRRVPKYPAWGREVTIQLDAPQPLVPGRAFDVRFETKSAMAPSGATTPTTDEGGQHG